jgi:hypothetical protein
MKNYILFTIIVLSLPLFCYSQSQKDLSQVPTNFDNPYLVSNGTLQFTRDITESFEDPTFPPTGWTTLNPDGGTGWNRQTVGTTFPGWTGGIITAPPGGENAVAYCTWSTGGPAYNDQWLVTPQRMNVGAGDMLMFWLLAPVETSDYLDSLDIWISTTGTNIGDFNVLVDTLVFPEMHTDTSWTEYSYVLADFVPVGSDIYVGFREHVPDNLTYGAAFLLDLVTFTTPVSVETGEGLNPNSFSISQNYPNPFNPSTIINYTIAEQSMVTINVYDVIGTEVATLVNEEKARGNYSLEFNAKELTSGIYFYKIQAGSFIEVKKMVLMK